MIFQQFIMQCDIKRTSFTYIKQIYIINISRTNRIISFATDQNSVSMVVSPNQPNLSFKLKLLRSAQTYNHPEQMWQFISEFSVRDYSGTYYIKLIPCTVTQVSDLQAKAPVQLVVGQAFPIRECS